MKQIEGVFEGIKGLDLHYQVWLPEKDPKAILLVVHGLAEHIGRYQNLVNYFVPRGYAIYGFDLRGHGKSPGLKGYVERFSNYLDDLKTFFDIVHRESATRNIFLLGHSLGGLIATAYVTGRQEGLAGLAVSAPLLKVGSSISSATIALAKVLSSIAPKMGVAVLDASAISRDKTVVDAYVNDPLVYRGKTTARLGAELIKTIQKVPAQVSKITLPILIMYGSEDQLTDPEGSNMLYEKVGSKDKTLKVYNGLYHEIFNEPEHDQVFKDMEAWLSAHNTAV